jgi:hypothetical protein
MNTLYFRFNISLYNDTTVYPISPNGPVFHRWLPDGKADAIDINIPQYNTKMKIWFERCGHVLAKFIEFDLDKHEVDAEIMKTQGALQGGRLYGLLYIDDVPLNEYDILKSSKESDNSYLVFGKKIVQDMIYPQVSRFIKILRDNYGQYWIKELEKWDSRKYSLGYYCHTILNLLWSETDIGNWQPFIPDTLTAYTSLTISSKEDFHEYISKENWDVLNHYIAQDYYPPYSSEILLSCRKCLDQDDCRQAFIEAVIAFEVASAKYLKDKAASSSLIIKSMASYNNLALVTQLSVLGMFLGYDLKLIENAIKAIETRNKISHEGFSPSNEAKQKVQALMKIISGLIEGPTIKFPKVNPGNLMMPEEEWEK